MKEAMRDKNILPQSNARKQHTTLWQLHDPEFRGGSEPLTGPQLKDQICYPSPPMSSPPSSPISAPELVRGHITEALSFSPTTSIPEESSAPSSIETQPRRYPTLHGQSLQTRFDRPPQHVTSSGPSFVQQSSFGGPNSTAAPGETPAFAGNPQSGGRLSSRSGRKPKAHVASACINCKRAHLSCDVHRPCARCVAAGKQDTCHDVVHKRRGRPRLRDEADFRVEQGARQQPPSTSAAPMTTSSRPIATPRRRTDSLRSLRSQTSEASSIFTPILGPPSLYNYPQPTSSAVLAPAEVPTAFLDVDLLILRANRPFQQILNDGLDVKGRHLAEVVTPADGEGFQVIRNRLRSEREAREPAYMPPIVQTSGNPVQGVSESDVERLTSGFADYTYSWARNQGGLEREMFPARVRMGKTTAYFVVVTLPSFRPTGTTAPNAASMNPWPPPPLSPTAARAQRWPVQSASSSAYLRPLQPSLPAQDYTAQRIRTHEQPILPSIQRPSPLLPPFEGTYGPHDEIEPLQQPPVVLSQRGSTHWNPLIDSADLRQRQEGVPQPATSFGEEEDDSRSPKRRRIGIQEVLR